MGIEADFLCVCFLFFLTFVAPYRIKLLEKAPHQGNINKELTDNISWKLRGNNESLIRRMRNTGLNDVVSKNITIILEDLLKNYESSQLPSHGKGHPTVVQTNILIRSMGPVSELDMEYSMDCYFRQYWRDQRLSFVGPIKSLSLSIKMLERIWRPDTYFYNGKNSYVHTITVPNKLLRISQDGDILYSMRLTIKAKCPMELKSFPMDRQSCPLLLGSYAYTSRDLVYHWQNDKSVNFVAGMTLSQFDLMSYPSRNFTFKRREGEFSVLEVSFNLQRHTGYFLIQVYVPCILIVVLSWVSFWIHREATSDRVGLGITTVLTLSTISLDSRTDLPKVRYATALDWFLLMSFFYCIATLLEFAGVHYFTKVGSGEIPIDEDEWEDCDEPSSEFIGSTAADLLMDNSDNRRRRSSIVCPIYNTTSLYQSPKRTSLVSSIQTSPSVKVTVEKTTQTECKLARWKQFLYCLKGDDKFRKQRQREAAALETVSKVRLAPRFLHKRHSDASQWKIFLQFFTIFVLLGVQFALILYNLMSYKKQKLSGMLPSFHYLLLLLYMYIMLEVFYGISATKKRSRSFQIFLTPDLNKRGHHGSIRHVNSVSLIDRVARIVFPASFCLFNLFYWMTYIMTQESFKWGDNKLNPQSH